MKNERPDPFDMWVAWHYGRSSYVSRLSGAIDYFNYSLYQESYNPAGTRPADFIRTVKQ